MMTARERQDMGHLLDEMQVCEERSAEIKAELSGILGLSALGMPVTMAALVVYERPKGRVGWARRFREWALS